MSRCNLDKANETANRAIKKALKLEKHLKDEQNKKIEELQERIDKAIKYMNEAITSDSFSELPSGKTTAIEECIPAFKDLLEILKGKDKE